MLSSGEVNQTAVVEPEQPVQSPQETLPFEGLPPDLVMDQLKKLSADQILDGKCFWKSYDKWDKLDPKRKTNTVVFVQKKLSDTIRSGVYSRVREQVGKAAQEDKLRQAHSNKHDKARLLHLRKDPRAANVWQRALSDKSRTELDADHNQEFASAWSELAGMFNDYKTYIYENACVVAKRSPDGPTLSVPGMEKIHEDCHDYDPTAKNRPERDAKWVRLIYRELKSQITLVSDKYHRSGNQEAENVYDEWVKFSRRTGNDLITYARAVFDTSEIQKIGRTIRSDIARDTGALPSDEEISEDALKRKAKEWKDKMTISGKKRKNVDDSASSNEESKQKTVASVLEQCMLTQMLLQCGGEDVKQRIIQDMLQRYQAIGSPAIKHKRGDMISSHSSPNSNTDCSDSSEEND